MDGLEHDSTMSGEKFDILTLAYAQKCNDSVHHCLNLIGT